MGDYNKDSEQDNPIDILLRDMYGCSDDDLLDEFEAASHLTAPRSFPETPSDEFEKIWAMIQEERSESKETTEPMRPENGKLIKPRFGWKRWAAIGLIACLMAGSGCMVAMGTKSYFYREREIGNINREVFVNDFDKGDVNGEEESYYRIEQEVGIKPLKLGYIPSDMTFSDFRIKDGLSYLKFQYEDDEVYFVQSKYDVKASYNFELDTSYEKIVENKWLKKDFKIKREKLSSGKVRYVVSDVIDGAYYKLFAVMDENEFIKMVERLTY